MTSRSLSSVAAGARMRLLVRLPSVRVQARLLSKLVRERMPDGTLAPLQRNPARRPVLLALSADQFRADPQHLAREGTFRVLELDSKDLRRLVYRFYPANAPWPDIISAKLRPDLAPNRTRYRAFLRRLLPELYRILGVRALISPHIHYATDVDWGSVSEALGIPYVVLHRENLYASRQVVDMVQRRFGYLGVRFEGRRVITHNPVVRDVMVEAKFAEAGQVQSLGCVRMDAYVRRLRAGKPNAARRIVIFPYSIGPDDRELFRRLRLAFDRMYAFLVRFARENPDVEILIKPKAKWMQSWREDTERGLRKQGMSLADAGNIVVNAELDAQELILSSTVVMGLNTTTVIEAGVAGRYTIIPFFEELHEPSIAEEILFFDSFPRLVVARTLTEFETHIRAGLAGAPLPEGARTEFEAVFERYVSALDGTATRRHVDMLLDATKQVVA